MNTPNPLSTVELLDMYIPSPSFSTNMEIHSDSSLSNSHSPTAEQPNADPSSPDGDDPYLLDSQFYIHPSNGRVYHAPDLPSYTSALTPAQVNGALVVEDGDRHVRDSLYIPLSTAVQFHDDHHHGENLQTEVASGPPDSTIQTREASVPDSSSRTRLFQAADTFSQRSAESAVAYGATPSFSADNIVQDTVASEKSVESLPQKANAKNLVTRGLEEERTECKSSGAGDFECNICLDIAKEPVVTSCSHLFCWPCLYRWLHVHRELRKCPVCKGAVTESNIIPIYSQRSSGNELGKKCGGDGLSSNIPPRPRGCRLEGLSEPISVPPPRIPMQEVIPWINRHEQLGSRVRMQLGMHRHLVRVSSSNLGGFRSSRNATGLALNPHNGNSDAGGFREDSRSSWSSHNRISPLNPVRDGIYVPVSHNFSSRNAGNSNMIEGVVNSGNPFATTASVDPQNPQPSDCRGPQVVTPVEAQASASSTVSVINGEFGATYAFSWTARVSNTADNSGNRIAASSSVNLQNPRPSHSRGTQVSRPIEHRASVSSTIAVIEGELGTAYGSDVSSESGVAYDSSIASDTASSHPFRRTRDDVSSSSDVDGKLCHSLRRRRLE